MSSLAKGLAKSKIESQYACQSPWSGEAWQAAREAYMSGTDKPPPRFPIVITQDCLISTAEKLQQLADLPTLPQIETTRTAPRRWEDLDAPPADDREVQICDVDMGQLNKIEEVTEGESISVWFRGTRRDARVAESLKLVSQNLNIGESLSSQQTLGAEEGNLEENQRTLPWSTEAWQAAGVAFLSGTDSPPPRFPIIISKDSLISTAEMLQQLANLPKVPNIETTRTAPRRWEDLDAPPADDREIKDVTEGESISVWFGGIRRDAWVAESLKQKIPQYMNTGESRQCFPIIICQDGLFSMAEKLQQFANLPMLPEIETARIVPMNYDEVDGASTDSKEVQICNVDGNKKYHIEYVTEGEIISVWFNGTTRTAWLARSLSSAQRIAADF
ncbi:hypothetical protein VE00_04232 [Pseudogymnoascus sp. WSF 3629]|nr:hypothetical protein VE00_04232 [Pseudogymnoascus sp. WSF 3629]